MYVLTLKLTPCLQDHFRIGQLRNKSNRCLAGTNKQKQVGLYLGFLPQKSQSTTSKRWLII